MATGMLSVYVVVDADGNYSAGTDADDARSQYESNHQDLNACGGFRLIELSVTVPLPKPIEVEVDVPETEESATVEVK